MMTWVIRVMDGFGQQRFSVFELIVLPSIKCSVVYLNVWFLERGQDKGME